MTIIQFALWDWRDDLEVWTAPNGKTYRVPAYVMFIANNGRGALYNLMLDKGMEKYSRYYRYEYEAFYHVEDETLAMANYIQGYFNAELSPLERRVMSLERRAMRINPHWSRRMVFDYIADELGYQQVAGAHHVASILETISEVIRHANQLYMAREAHQQAQAARDMERFAEYEAMAQQYNKDVAA